VTPNLQLAIWLLCGCCAAVGFMLTIPEKAPRSPGVLLFTVILGPAALVPLVLGLAWVAVKFALMRLRIKLIAFLIKKRNEARARIDAREARAKEAARQAENTN